MRICISLRDAVGKTLLEESVPELELLVAQHTEQVIRADVAKSANADRFVAANVTVEIELFVDISKEAQ